MAGQSLKRILLPGIKGIPLILLVIGLCVFVASKMVQYATPMYESTAKIKLDDIHQGFSGSTLYKDFDVFSTSNKITTEAEMLKSRVLLEKTIKMLGFDISYFRVGKVQTSEMYKNSPFTITYKIHDERLYNIPLKVLIENGSRIHVQYELQGEVIAFTTSFAEVAKSSALEITFFRSSNPGEINGQFEIVIQTADQIIQNQIGKNLDVKEIDKDISIIRVTFKSAVPEKARDFTNALVECYIHDYVETKTGEASKTLTFLEERLTEVSKQLDDAERALELYRLNHKVLNTKMEIEVGLKKIAELKVQLANLEMEEAALDTLNRYVNENKGAFIDKAPNYEGYGGLLYTEMIKRLKTLQAERRDLLTKYTVDNEKIIVIDSKIDDVIRYIKENIQNSRKSIAIKKQEIYQTIKEAEAEFDDMPTKEKELIILERNFYSAQTLFNFLTEKRTDAAIAQAATLSFHRIIQRAELAKKPVSPNRTFSLIVAAFLGMVISIGFIYAREFLSGKVNYVDDLEKASPTPVLGILKSSSKNAEESQQSVLAIAKKILLKVPAPQVIVVSSSMAKEGKTWTIEGLANCLGRMHKKVLVIDGNIEHASMTSAAGAEHLIGWSDTGDLKRMEIKPCAHYDLLTCGNSVTEAAALLASDHIQKIVQHYRAHYDLILMDTPAVANTMDAIFFMKEADMVLFIVRAAFTPIQHLNTADFIKEEYGLTSLYLVLNDVQRAVNYDGKYTGSRFQYNSTRLKGLPLLIHYFKHYLR